MLYSILLQQQFLVVILKILKVQNNSHIIALVAAHNYYVMSKNQRKRFYTIFAKTKIVTTKFDTTININNTLNKLLRNQLFSRSSIINSKHLFLAQK